MALDALMPRAFLTAEWRYLAMLNWRVDPALLQPFVPAGTTLDQWNGATYVSLVGFLFRDTRLLGVPVPLHRDFEELNLRFYVVRDASVDVVRDASVDVVRDASVDVVRDTGVERRRGVTFIRELVPRVAIATVARLAYNEPYLAVPMRHELSPPGPGSDGPSRVSYQWRHRGRWGQVAVEGAGPATLAAAGSEEEFITEHYWGYTRQRDGGTVEYEVTHPKWRLWRVTSSSLDGDLAALYGPAFAEVLAAPPSSAFLAEGSRITVNAASRLTNVAPSRSRDR